MELGAEEVHGLNSDLYKIVEKHGGCPFDYWKEKIMYGEYKGELRKLDDLREKYPEVEVACRVYDTLMDPDSKVDYKGLNTYEYLKKVQKEYLESNEVKQKGNLEHSDPYSERADHIIEGLMGVECGTDAKNLCPQVYNSMEVSWQSGDSNMILMKRSYIDILEDEFKKEIDTNIKYNIEINKVILNKEGKEYDSVTLETSKGAKQGPFDYVISSLPVPVLREIQFEPQLSDSKLQALNILTHDDTAKLILKFKKKFWPDDLAIKYIESKIPTWWPSGKEDQRTEFLLTGMTSGENCRYMDCLFKQNEKEFIELAISDLERVYKINIRKLLLGYYWYNWKNDKYAKGGYTYHTMKEDNSREELRKSHLGKVLFCGDALSRFGHISTVHGAYDTGKVTAKELLEVIRSK
eukprot:CAMPEP_0170520412 /NCGR_PEP_ID=MMETSP0209-20121228/5706_1 /TAXON_ID=665100 ORGANISM="Litonotus pictus, Strain P1" /NCGR_SAMPLE_ID=MMETSP0209 /ASSEMBLY_ACC=CAM_ASM_000301 /LENGTH=407 /DNA_ID=CAMNT_0010806693 /DNA_START=182 /DNA_END=1405 /DNA_ORIENTATION=+